MIERAQSYINGILSGEITAGKWIRLAMERHVNDLKKQNTLDFPYYFDEDEARRVLDLYSLFRFSKGKESGQPFDLMPWFAALVYMAYGWRRNDGNAGRRFRKVYCKVARGNAKTANLVTIGTIGFLFDGASDAEVYWIAMDKEQAKIGWDRQREMLKYMVADFPELQSELYIPEGKTSSRITRQSGISFVGYYGQNTKGRDGLSPYYAICDEYHEWDRNDVMDRVESGMVKVENPVTWIITTAGYNPLGPNSQFLTSCKNILSGITENDELLAFIYELDEGDDWRDENVWCKANPALLYSPYDEVLMTGMRTEYNKIKSQGTTKEIDFKVKNLNIEQAGSSGWIPDEKWMQCAEDYEPDDLLNRECWGGLDMAATSDFNSFVLFFPPTDDKKGVIIPYYWLPEDAVQQHKSRRPFVEQWVRDGILRTTQGDVADYELIRRDIVEICAPYFLQSIGFDRQFSSYIVPGLMEDGIRMEVAPQTWMYLTPAALQLEHGIYGKNFTHGGHPILRWNMANVSMQRSDRNDNYLPSKGKSAEKIDGIAATLNAIGQWLKERSETQQSSYLFEKDAEIIMF